MTSFVSAPLPALDLDTDAYLTVDTQDSNAKVTALTIHLAQDTPEDVIQAAQVAPLLAYVPQP